jgi:hypothetical protein
MRDVLDIRKCGDSAFENKDFRTAINCYSQVNVAAAETWIVYFGLFHLPKRKGS